MSKEYIALMFIMVTFTNLQTPQNTAEAGGNFPGIWSYKKNTKKN